MSQEPTKLETAFVDAWPVAEWRDLHIVLAVSGGADSVAMLRASLAARQRAGGRGKLFVAHFNHGLRPQDAAADEAWLAELCHSLDVPLEIGRGNVPALAADRGDGLEAAAREARYDFLLDTAGRLGARYVAVAHTADDQVETVLHRMIRGTGLAGLAGMPRMRPLSSTVSLVRPLLAVGRAEVLRYLDTIGQDYRTDATNAEPRFTRNRLRVELLPTLRSEYNTEVDQALMRLAAQADETQQFVAALAGRLHQRCMVTSPSRVTIDCTALAAEPPLLIREACKIAWTTALWPLQDMGFDEWRQLASLITKNVEGNTLNLPGGVRADRIGNRLEITPST